jgi:predicted RNA binding protein YcfA (HicA-like mRNA interferase family)
MSEKLPRVTADDAIRVLERAGFSFSRQSGSHKIYKNKESRREPSLIIQARFSTRKS